MLGLPYSAIVTQTLKFSGAKIKQARLAKGWSQAELAYRANVRERQVIRWENDQNEPRLDGIAKIAAAVGRTVDDFLADANGSASSDDDEEADAMADIERVLMRLVRKAVAETQAVES